MRTLAVRRASAVLLAALTIFAFTPRAAWAAASVDPNLPTNTTHVPVSGTATVGGQTVPVSGFFNIQKFVAQGGQLIAIGTLTTTSGAANGVTVQVPVVATDPPACDILDLHIGAIHLDLLGLVIDLAPVDLQITAVPGAGNLLGNLLCAIVGLLDSTAPGALSQIAALLNQILGILNGL